MRRWVAGLIGLGGPLAWCAPAQAEPWTAKRTEFALAAVGETRIAPGTPATQWNVLAIGLFCGTRAINPGKINLYLYGIGDDRMATGRPIRATLDVDGRRTDLDFRAAHDVMVSPVSADLVRSLTGARSVSVSVADYNSPKPDAVDMTGARPAIARALRGCLK